MQVFTIVRNFIIFNALTVTQFSCAWEFLSVAETSENSPEYNFELNGVQLPGEPLNPDDFERARIYGQLHNDKDELPLNPSNERVERVMGRALPQKWKNGRIPYEISNDFTVDERTLITSATMEFSSRTEGCIHLVSRMPLVNQMEKDYVNITKGGKYCTSFMGRRGRGQVLNLSPNCISRGTIIHEMMHALGFDHEHQRSDRDKYIEIKYENIVPELANQFETFNDTWNERSSAYDYGSILHYTDDANCNQDPCNVKTIVVKDTNSTVTLGQRNGLSKLDLEKIEKLYRCKDRKPIDMVNNAIPSNAFQDVTNDGTGQMKLTSRGCIDFDARCKSVSTSDCGRNQTWINFNCRKTCGTCDSNCQDYNSKCEEWSYRNSCKEYPEYMLIYCQKACGFCDST